MATTGIRSKQSRPGSALDGPRRPTQRMRPSTIPAYYMGRPAWVLMAIFRHPRSHADGAREG